MESLCVFFAKEHMNVFNEERDEQGYLGCYFLSGYYGFYDHDSDNYPFWKCASNWDWCGLLGYTREQEWLWFLGRVMIG